MKKIQESGIFLLIFMSTILLGTTLLFFIKVSITRFHLLIFMFLSSFLYYLLRKRKPIKEIGKMILLSIGVIALSILISTFLFDRSSDGNTYHKDAIGVLKEGWNPIYEDSTSFITRREDDSKKLTNYSIWIDHYAKANWIIAANFYSLTGNIESGKAMNLISIYIVFSFMVTTLVEILGTKKAILLSLITVINPLTAAQLLTFYNDILVCLYLFLAIVFLIKLDKNPKEKEIWLYYGLTFIMLANMKFNGLGYLLVFSFLFVCRYLYKAWTKKEFLETFKKLCLFFIPLFIIALILVGYPTYVKNTLDHHNPFFPLYDEDGEDIITAQQPKSFKSMNTMEKLFYATFTKANNLRDHDKTTLKIPFTVSKDEIIPATSNDLRISGWGVLFSGLFLCSIFIFIFYYPKYKKESFLLYTLGITVFLLMIMSESWWARYTPHFYLFIILALYVLLKYGSKRWITFIYTVLISINTLLPLMGNSYYTLKNSISILKDFSSLRNREIVVNDKGMNGIFYNLKDFHIPYRINPTVEGKELYYHYLEYQEKNK